MQIGKVNFPHYPLVLAPMENVTNIPFRLLCKGFGADWLYTEFISADALIRDIKRAVQKVNFSAKERPFSIQLYGKNIIAMKEAAKIVEQQQPDFIDINFGCPVKKIAGKGAGAGFLKDIPKMLQLTQKVVKAVNIPVTVKTRLGWDENSTPIVTIAEQLQDIGVQALTIHGHTRKQMFKGEANWSLIGSVKNNPKIKIPIIGNGDIDSPQKAKLVFDEYGLDAIMVGRAAIGKPWIFHEIKHYLQYKKLINPYTIGEQINIIQKLLLDTIAYLGETKGILQTRKHMAKMFKGFPAFKPLRLQMLQADNKETILRIFKQIEERCCVASLKTL